MSYSALYDLTHQELVSDAIAAGIIEENESNDHEDWQLIEWIREANSEAMYDAHVASFYSY